MAVDGVQGTTGSLDVSFIFNCYLISSFNISQVIIITYLNTIIYNLFLDQFNIKFVLVSVTRDYSWWKHTFYSNEDNSGEAKYHNERCL